MYTSFSLILMSLKLCVSFYRFFSYLKLKESKNTSGFEVFILNAEQKKQNKR